MTETRRYTNEDARRELAVEMFKKHVRASLGRSTAHMYEADIEYMEHALVAFADEWANRDLAVPAPGSGLCESCGAPVTVYDALVDGMVLHDCQPKSDEKDTP